MPTVVVFGQINYRIAKISNAQTLLKEVQKDEKMASPGLREILDKASPAKSDPEMVFDKSNRFYTLEI